MKGPEETTQEGRNNSTANGVASSQKRRPPKLRLPKLGKRTIPSEGQSQGREQRETGGSERSQSNSPSPNSVTKDQSLDNQDSPRLEKTPENPQIHQRTTIRREPAPSAEPDRVEVIEREQRSISPESKTRETRVRQMLSPEVQNKEIVRAPDSHHAGQQGELLQNGTNPNPNPGQVIETTEEVTNTKGNDQLKLRLDLNLDIEIELKAKIRGDLTLQLLQ